MPSVGIYRPPAARKLEQYVSLQASGPALVELDVSTPRTPDSGISMFRSAISSIKTQNETTPCAKTTATKAGRTRRPDMQVYVPRGRRNATQSKDSACVKLGDAEAVTPLRKECREYQTVREPSKQPVTEEKHAEQGDAVTVWVEESSQVFEEADSVLVSSSDESNVSCVSGVSEMSGVNPDEGDWDSMYDESGECLQPDLLDQLSAAVGEVSIEKPLASYDTFSSKTLYDAGDSDRSPSEFPHVIEIYNFPPEFKTQDLMTVFSEFKNSGFEIRWVDETHALGIFSCATIVSEVLAFRHPFVKTRPLKDGTALSKAKARKSAEMLQPYRPRPDTCAALARRLVTGALGVKLATSREEREAERKLLKEAREKKRLVAKQKEEAWEGTFS